MDPEKNRLQHEAPRFFDELFVFSLFMTGSHKQGGKLLKRIISEASGFYRYHEPADMHKWLLRIALTLYDKHYLVNSGYDSEKIDSGFEALNLHADSFFIEESFKKMDEKALLKLLSSVPSELRVVLILKEILSLDYETISELADIPEGTVITRLTRARRFIYSQLAEKA
jgi:RNA polymerase sigma-70 factor, ECF subfamily